MSSKKFNFEYYIQRAQVLNEMAGRPISHKLMLSVLTGDKMEKFSKLASDILHQFRYGTTKKVGGEPLIDSKGNPAPGLTTSSDDRYNKWVLTNLILASRTDSIQNFEVDDELINKVFNSPIGEDLKEKYPHLEDGNIWNKISDILLDMNGGSIINQAKRIVLRHSLNDNENYFKLGNSGAKLMKSAMMLIIKEYPDILDDSEFIRNVYNHTGIADYMNSEETGRLLLSNAYSLSRASQRLSKLGIDIKHKKDDENEIDVDAISSSILDIDQLQSKANPLLALIYKESKYRRISEISKNKATKKFMGEQPQPTNEKDDTLLDNDYTANATLISGTLKWLAHTVKITKNLINDKLKTYKGLDQDEAFEDIAADTNRPKQFIQLFHNTKLGIVKSFIQFVDQSSNGISFYDFFSQIDQLKDTYSSDESITNTLDLIKYYTKKVGIASQYIQKEKSNRNFPGFDDDIIEKHANTPEKMEIFRKWYNTIYIPRKISETKNKIDILTGQIAKNQSEESRAFSNFEKQTINKLGNPVNRSGVLSPDNTEFITSEKDRLESTPKNKWTNADYIIAKQIGLLDDKDDVKSEEGAMDFLRKHTRSELSKKHKGAFNKIKESYVMNYMTEQVHKDRFKPRGEFKDRGFKKLNYHEWLERNS